MSKPSDLVQGTLDLLILNVVALQPLNGWAVGKRLYQISRDTLQVSDGSLYPALVGAVCPGVAAASAPRLERRPDGGVEV